MALRTRRGGPIAALGALALAAVLLVGLLRPQPVAVEVGTVERGPFVAVLEEEGRTRVRDRYVVSAPLGGRVLRLGIRPGDTVERDAVLAVMLAAPSPFLDERGRREAEERVGAAEAMAEQSAIDAQRAEALQRQALADAGRTRALFARGIASGQQMERADLAAITAARDFEAAERRRHAAEHELALAQAVLRRAGTGGGTPERQEVRAAVAGRVLRVLQESEAVVAAGTPLVEIADPSDLEVIADVLTTEAVGVVPGARVSVERWGGTAALAGRVRRVEPGAFTKISALGVEEQRVRVVIDLVSPRDVWARLGDGFRVEARIEIARVENAVLVPAGALFRRGDGWAVFVRDAEAGTARERAVAVSRRGARQAIVDDGLTPGETVVLFPPTGLRDGARTRLIR